MEFFNTRMGRALVEGTLPDIARSLARIAKSLETQAGTVSDAGGKVVQSEKTLQGSLELLRGIEATPPMSSEDSKAHLLEIQAIISDFLAQIPE